MRTFLPPWHKATRHGEMFICGQFLVLPELAFRFGGPRTSRRRLPTTLLPGPRLRCLILSQRGCEAGRSRGQDACHPRTPFRAVQLVTV